MDPTDPAQGQEPDQCYNITHSVKGRQRKKNLKYSDFQTEGRRRSDGRAASKQTPEKSRKPKDESHQTAGGDIETPDETPEEPNGKISEETQKKAAGAKRTPARKTPKKSPARKSPAKKTPAKKTPAKKTPVRKSTYRGPPAGEGEGVNVEKQENGAPKRKYVRKRPTKEPDPVTEPPCTDVQQEPPVEPEEEEIQPGGRRRRGAAKAALRYLHSLAKEVLNNPNDESGSQTDPDPKSRQRGKGRKGQKRKRADSDDAEDEDFIPCIEDDDFEEAEEVKEEEEEEEENSDLDFKSTRSRPATSHVNRTSGGQSFRTPNGLTINFMKVVWDATETTKKLYVASLADVLPESFTRELRAS